MPRIPKTPRTNKMQVGIRPASVKQKAARDRNWRKAQAASMYFVCNSMPAAANLTNSEKREFEKAARILDRILDNWDKNSRKLGFNVPHRTERFKSAEDWNKLMNEEENSND